MMPTFNRIGDCNRFCGQCCSLQHWKTHYDTLATSLLAQPPFTGMNEQGECNHLRWNQGRAVCGIYEERPEICRIFPNHPLSVATIPSCTFRLVAETSGGGEDGSGQRTGTAGGAVEKPD